MKIKKLYIENFRSIKRLTLNPYDLCALVWPNSAWKTNILKAIDLVIWEWWTTKAKVVKELFNDVSSPIKIEIEFEENLIYNYYWTVKNIKVVTLDMKYSPDFICEIRMWEVSWHWEKHWWRNNEWYYMNDEFKKNYHFMYIPAERNLDNELRVNKWSMLWRLMKHIQDNYVKHYDWDESKLRDEFIEKMQDATTFLENDFNDEITFHKFKEVFSEFCKNNSYWLANDFEPKLNIYNLNWFYKTLQINISEDHTDKTFNTEDVGAWMKNLVLISIFQTYSKLVWKNVIFWIEEPEIYMYPQAQRWLYKSFQELSEQTQIFYTTHSQNFVDWFRAYEVELVNKDWERWTYLTQKSPILTPDGANRERFKIYTQFNTDRNELFFARKVIFVEWDSDKVLYSVLFERKWVDINKIWVSIIECWWKWWVCYFLWVSSLLWIENYIWVWDSDNESDFEDKHWVLSSAITNWHWIEIEWNLESYINSNCEHKIWTSNKVKDAYEWASNVNEDKIPEKINEILNFVIWNLNESIEEFDEDLPF